MRTSTVAAIIAALSLAGCQSAQRAGSYVPLSASATGAAAVEGTATERVIYSFPGAPNGWLPEASPIVDASGRLYGPTMRGGVTSGSDCGGTGCGEIYRLSLAGGRWVATTLASFNGNDGDYPSYPVVADATGNLYGATDVGGDLGVAYGLVSGRLQQIHNFRGGHDGAQPRSNLIFDRHGNLYGTTVSGGTGGSGGNGTVYELTPGSGGKWTETVLHRFTLARAGTNPQAGVIFADGGRLFGTTSYGGNTACAAGCGVVYELTPSGSRWRAAVIHAFDGSDGDTSVASLVSDTAGNLYGTADEGGTAGCYGGCGTLFELQPKKGGGWGFSVIHNFNQNTGGGPKGNLVFDKAGNIYGSTVIGGNISACRQQIGCGVVFKLAPAAHGRWTYTVLHIFNNTPDGALANGVVLAPNGRLYGTTIGGGTFGQGAVFEVKP